MHAGPTGTDSRSMGFSLCVFCGAGLGARPEYRRPPRSRSAPRSAVAAGRWCTAAGTSGSWAWWPTRRSPPVRAWSASFRAFSTTGKSPTAGSSALEIVASFADAQAAHGRARRRVPVAARRRGHARRAVRGLELDAGRAAAETERTAERRWLLRRSRALSSTARKTDGFIRPGSRRCSRSAATSSRCWTN